MFRDLASLVKPRIVALLCLTGACALLAAGGTSLSRSVGFVVAGALVAAGSAALNCWYDRDLDREMERTADRPLPAGRLDHRLALAFAIGLLGAGTLVGLIALPPESVGYMWLGVASYVGLYTIGLKRRHPLGVVLGGSAGSFPVLAGWSVVEHVGAEALTMAALVFTWTPAHAWALAHVYRDDFAAAGVATLPAVAPLDRALRGIWGSVLTTVFVALAAIPLVGPIYAGSALAGSACFLLAYRGYVASGAEPSAVRAFFSSNCYLAVVFLGWAAEGLVSTPGSAPSLVAGTISVTAFLGIWIARPRLRDVRATAITDGDDLLERIAITLSVRQRL